MKDRLLAPVEGILDSLVRELLTEVSDCDPCITESACVMNQLLLVRVFRHICPRLQNANRTPSGTLMRVQLSGQSPQWLAENAARAVGLDSQDVDLNCGCPSKAVNGSGGGATLLKDPELIYQGTKAMHEAIPTHPPISVKTCLGWNSGEKKFEITDAVQQVGATELAVYGRTKEQGYCAEHIDWQAISEIRQQLNIPVIAGDGIRGWQNARRCIMISSCDAVMIGRRALNVPNLGRVIEYNEPRMSWPEVITPL